jgi:protein-S-isoprenylcysteine O-methyltransferase Ste14
MKARVAAALSAIVGAAGLGALLFLVAGTTDWAGAWAWLVLFAVAGVASAALAPASILAERLRGPVRSGQPRGDRAFVVVFGAMVLGWFALLSLDRRFGWSSVSVAVQVVAALLFLAANAIVIWVLRANPYASGSVRIADDQRVATSGPYRVVRHPMYASVLLYLPATALVCGSVVGAVASAVLVVGLAVRTRIEEAALRDGLPGYAEYAQQVRWRLVPRVW